MLISLNWLKDYVDLEGMNPEAIAKALTDIGLEVEGIEPSTPFTRDIVAAKMTSAVPHPNADTLTLCRVDCGEGEPMAIVCGAPNAREGIKVALVKVGSELPGGFKVKKTKIRGETSYGMMCSERELGISDEHDGIIELADDATIGTSVVDILGLVDTVFELSITPNRADCQGYLGIARDLAAKLGKPLKEPVITVPRDDKLSSTKNVKVEIENPEDCPRFVALYISDVKPVPSPGWLKRRIEASGMRSLNLLVDATNYAMLEYGQPIHPYDERHVNERVFKVRRARAKETIRTLDGQDRALIEEDLLICDGSAPIAVAGVMGGENSEVMENTENLIVEVAYFAPTLIRKTSKRLGLHTEASHRFERGVDINILPKVALRVGDLLYKCCQELTEGGVKDLPLPRIAADEVDAYPTPYKAAKVAIRLDKARTLLAMGSLKLETAIKHLESLQFKVLDKTDNRILVEVPHWRHDIVREVDLIEEVGRLEGFDGIPYLLPEMNIAPTPEDVFIDFCEEARVVVAQTGFRETISFPFRSTDEMEVFGIEESHPLFPSLLLANPLNDDNKLVQTTLIPGLVKAIDENRHHGETGGRLFECGRAYFDFFTKPLDEKAYPTFANLSRKGRHLTRQARANEKRPTERHLLAAVMDQPLLQKGWLTEEQQVGFFHGKELVLSWMHALGAASCTFHRINAKDLPYLHPGAAAEVRLADQFVGYVGEMHPKTAARIGLGADSSPLLIEIDLEAVFELRQQKVTVDARMWRFPPVTRDFAFLVDATVTHEDFVKTIAGFAKRRNMNRYNLFDVYEGENLPAGKKSMAYTFHFRSPDRTLTDKEVESEIAALVDWLGSSLSATLR